MKRRVLVPVLFGLALLCGGCSEEDANPVNPGPGNDVPDSDLPFPGTPDQLMVNFVTIYQAMDPVEYSLILDPAFETLLLAATQAEFPDLGPTLDVAEENRIHGRLFSGEALTTPEGDLLPPTKEVVFNVFRKVVDWGLSLPTDPIPETLSALYDVDIILDRGQSYALARVQGQIRFYVTEAEGRIDGQPQTYYRLVGQLDLTGSLKGSEQTSWGSFKALYY